MDPALILVFSTPIAVAAVGEAVNQRGGVLNIGLEGTMLAAAFFGMASSGASGSPWVGLAVGGLVGAAFSLLQAVFVVRLAADQVVVGTAVNLFSLGLTSLLFRSQYGGSGQLLSVPQVPKFGGIDLVVLAALALALLAWWALAKTRWGLALRAAGGYPPAVEASGFSVESLRTQGLLIGGVLGGVAGAYLSLGFAGSFAENMTAGRGFVAIAMVTFGRWNPLGALAASVLVGGVETLQFLFQAKGWNIPFQFLSALPYVLALLVLVGAGRGRGAPAALGVPYRRRG